jgi:hypothetical protein
VQFKLKGTPWSSTENSALAGALLRTLDERGFVVLAFTNISARHVEDDNGCSYAVDADSWFVAPRPAATDVCALGKIVQRAPGICGRRPVGRVITARCNYGCILRYVLLIASNTNLTRTT